MTLTSREKAHLRSLAHSLDPVVRIGRAGLSDSVVAETQRALDSHELIKVRIDADAAPERRSLAEDLAERTGADLAGTVGKVAMLYRRREEDPAISFPRSRATSD